MRQQQDRLGIDQSSQPFDTSLCFLDIEKVATGEYWPGIKAKALGLVDDITTSDDYILSHYPAREIFSVKYSVKKNVAEKLGMSAANVVERVFMKSMNKARHWF